MTLRAGPRARAALLTLAGAALGGGVSARPFTDAAGRTVEIAETVERVLAARGAPAETVTPGLMRLLYGIDVVIASVPGAGAPVCAPVLA